MANFHGNSSKDKHFPTLTLPTTSIDRDHITDCVALISIIGRWNCVKRLWSPWWRKDQVWFRE